MEELRSPTCALKRLFCAGDQMFPFVYSLGNDGDEGNGNFFRDVMEQEVKSFNPLFR